MENDYLVDPVEKFRLEIVLQRIFDVGLDFPVCACFFGQLLNLLAGDVAGHNDNGVFEIDGSAFAVGESAVVEDLQQHVEHIAVRLFDLVEQNHRIRFSATASVSRPPSS